MKKKRVFHAAELFDDKVLIAGGVGTKADVEIFGIKRNECTERPPYCYIVVQVWQQFVVMIVCF